MNKEKPEKQKQQEKSSISSIKAVFIDVDNTLLNFEAYVQQAMEKGFAHYGLKKYEPWMFDCFTAENDKLWIALEKKELTFAELKDRRWNIIFDKLDIDFDGHIFEEYFREEIWNSAIPEKGAMELLEYLHGKYVLCAASNGPYEQQMHRMELGKMLHYFSFCFISEKLGVSKPAPEFFEKAFEQLNANREVKILPGETMIIGDSMTSDMAGGIAYGMQTCLYLRGKNPAEINGAERIDYTVKELSEIIDRGIL